MHRIPKVQKKREQQSDGNADSSPATKENASKSSSTDGELEHRTNQMKKRRRSLGDTSADGPSPNSASAAKRPKAARRANDKSPSSSASNSSASVASASVKPNSDSYCWMCHKEGNLVCCDVCPRSYHLRCIGVSAVGEGDWVCPECELVLRAENTDTRSPAMQLLDLDQLCTLLKFALGRMKIQCPEEFLRPVSLDEFPTYSNFVIHPIDVSTLEKNIKQRMYGSTESFAVDAKWILHNCIIYNGFQHKLTSVAKAIMKVCQQEMAEIEVCPDCYHNAHTKRENWFQETCNLPHLLVWAKLKGFPFWPGKAMKIVSGSVDVRFFGAHDRAWIPVGQCYLLSKDIPTPLRTKKRVFEHSMEELEQHIRKLRERFGEFVYANPKTRFLAKDVLTHLQNMLPKLENPSRLERFLLNLEGTKSEVEGERNAIARDEPDDCGDLQGKGPKTTFKPRELSVKNLETTIEKIKAHGSHSGSGNGRNDELMPMCEVGGTGDAQSTGGSNCRSGEEKEEEKIEAVSVSDLSSAADECSDDKDLAFSTDEKEDDDDLDNLLPISDSKHGPVSKRFSSGVGRHRIQSPSLYDGVGKYSEKMVNFMHDTMDEMLRELAKKTSKLSTYEDRVSIKKLEFEMDKLKWRHRQEMAEAKHNNDLVLMEMRNSLEADKERCIARVRRQCGQEKVRAVSDAKKKQWCALCGKEANLYCCWNTSYCDYPCQESHWPIHVGSCTQPTSVERGKSVHRKQVQPSPTVKRSSFLQVSF